METLNDMKMVFASLDNYANKSQNKLQFVSQILDVLDEVMNGDGVAAHDKLI